LSPEYATLGQLSEKVDVFSYGVLLLEIVSGRKNIDLSLETNKIYLLQWVSVCTLDVVALDENLVNEIQDYKMLQYIRKSRETLSTSMRSSKMGLLLQPLGSWKLLNHLFMVEFVEPVPTKIIGSTNIDAGQDNNIVVFEEEVQDIRNMATREKKI